MAFWHSKEFAVRQSRIKEDIDRDVCRLGNSISDICFRFGGLSKGIKKFFANACCSAGQLSDYQDNRIGRDCADEACLRIGFPLFTVEPSCQDCCTRHRVGPDTEDGPGTDRPCGSMFNGVVRWEEAYKLKDGG